MLTLARKLLPISVAVIMSMMFAACQKEEGAAEKAGKETDKAATQSSSNRPANLFGERNNEGRSWLCLKS